jgi:superfamily II DNA or RNA helicase
LARFTVPAGGIQIALLPGLDRTPLTNESVSAWQHGDRLILRGSVWTVADWTPFADCEALRLDDVVGSRSQTFLLPFDRPRRIPAGRLVVLSPRAWMHAFARILLATKPYGGLLDWPSTLDLLPYQLEPALAMLRDGHARLLIADDVGLGKTIETGLILRELSRRHGDFRALILTPAGLRQQWRDELTRHFAMETTLSDADWLRAMGRCLPPDVNPWSAPGIYVASFDFVKRPEAVRPLEDVRWDLLVVDEAHVASIATDRRAAIHGIALRSRRMVLLTATPPADHSQFRALCSIGALPDDPAIVLFRRARTDGGRRSRRSILLSVQLSNEEQRLHRMLERYTTLVWREARRAGNGHGLLLATTLRKRALSSSASLVVSLQRRRDLLTAQASPRELQMLLPLDEHDDSAREDIVSDDVLAAPGLSDAVDEQNWLETILAAALTAGTDDKSRVLVRLLKRIRQPALVFTEYRDTLEMLCQQLIAAGMPVCLLHGGLSIEERRRALEEFARGGSILLATDAAAEGLNLQSGCRVIVHYELPWNPSRMLQRAGRLDRIGQRHRVHEIALLASDTAESLVLGPLARRVMGWSDGAARGRMLEWLTESRVAESIFDGAVPHPPDAPPQDDPHTTVDLSLDAAIEAARHERRARFRVSALLHADGRRGSVAVTTLRRSSLQPGFVLMFDIRTSATNRRVIARDSVAIHAALALPVWPRKRLQIRRTVSDLLPALRVALSETLEAAQHRQRDGIRIRYQEAADRMSRRDRAMRRSQESVARQLVQAGLFERRPRRAVVARYDELASDGSTTAAGGSSELISSAELRAVLIVRPK